MTGPQFADLMEKIGFLENEPAEPIFILTRQDLKQPVFKAGFTKVAGKYHVVSLWYQEGQIAFWAKEEKSGDSLFAFHKEEVGFLAKKNKFRRAK